MKNFGELSGCCRLADIYRTAHRYRVISKQSFVFFFILFFLSLSNPQLTLRLSLKSTILLALSHQIYPFETFLILFRTFLTNQNSFMIQNLRNPKFQTLEPAALLFSKLRQISSIFNHISTCHYSLIT